MSSDTFDWQRIHDAGKEKTEIVEKLVLIEKNYRKDIFSRKELEEALESIGGEVVELVSDTHTCLRSDTGGQKTKKNQLVLSTG